MTVTNTKANQTVRAVKSVSQSTMAKKLKLSKDAKAIIAELQHKKGQHVLVTWERELKTRADVAFPIVKRTSAYVRSGIDYANLASVKAGIESGERGEVEPLKWGQWVEAPFIIGHTPKGGSYTEYVRLYPAVFANLKDQMRVEYVMDGVVSTAEQVKPYCLASEFREREEEVKCFTLKADSILSIGGE